MDAGSLDEADIAEGQRAMSSYAATLHQSGVLLEAQIFQPSATAKTLTKVDGSPRVQEALLGDSKMPIGGFFLIEPPTVDAALNWARQAPSLAWGAVVVRPGAVHVSDGGWVPEA